jgi:hypothetical protein
MKIKLFLLGILLCVAAAGARAADADFLFQSANTVPQGLRFVALYPSGTFTNGNGVIVTRDRVTGTTDTNGSLIISNVYGGDYRGELQGTYTVTTNWYHFPVTNGLIRAGDYLTAPTNGNTGYRAYTTAESDSRYLARGGDNGSALTNLTASSILGGLFPYNYEFLSSLQLDGSLVLTNPLGALTVKGPASAGSFTGNGAPLTNLTASSINPNSQIYSSTGIYCSIVMTNNGYRVSGLTGTHTNSANQSVNFALGNGDYVWNPAGKGNGMDGATNVGVFTNSSDATWILSFQFFGLNNPAWIIYKTNTWLYTSPASNAVVAALDATGTFSSNNRSSTYLPDMTLSNYWIHVPDGIRPSVSVTPIYATNVTSITASVYDPVSSIRNFPHVGPAQTQGRRWNDFAPFFPSQFSTPSAGIFRQTNGAGVLTSIEFMVSPAAGNLRSNYWLQIFPDYGTNPVAYSQVNSNFMTFNLPLTSLMSCKWDNTNAPLGIAGMGFSTEYTDVIMGSYNGTTAVMKEMLVLKCPCTNGMFIRIIDVLNNREEVTNLYANVNFETDQTGVLNYPFRDWRLHSSFARFVYAEPNARGASDWANTQVTLLSVTNRPGVIVGFWFGLDGLNSTINASSGISGAAMETAVWEAVCDGQYPPWAMYGEDIWGGPYETFLSAPVLARRFGIVNRTGNPPPAFPKSVDSYRQFPADFQISWQNSVNVFMSTASPGFSFSGDVATIYYSAP